MIYGYKNIWKVAGPILLGMVIQQLIGVTDVVFLGRVGQAELGASAIAGLLLHYHLHAGCRFWRRRADFDRPVKRARTLSPDCAGFLSGDGSDAGVCRRGDRRFLSADAVGAAASDQFAAGACGRAGLSAFPRMGFRLCLCRHRFSRFLRRHRQYPDFKLECGDHADRQCCRQLPADLRQFRFPEWGSAAPRWRR